VIGQPAAEKKSQIDEHLAIAGFKPANRGPDAPAAYVVLPYVPLQGRVTGQPQSAFLMGQVIVQVLHQVLQYFGEAIAAGASRQGVE
jgi:hypothetical protein